MGVCFHVGESSWRIGMKSARFILAFVLFSLLGTNIAFTQDHPALTAQANTVYVGADGKFESAPDTAQIQFNVSVQESTSQAAFQGASKDVDQVRQGVRAHGHDPQDVRYGV